MTLNTIVGNHRGSGAPSAMRCAGSVYFDVDEILLDSWNPAGLQGTVGHKIYEPLVLTGELPFDWKDLARAYGFEEKEIVDLSFMVYSARNFWMSNKASFPHAQVEVPLSHVLHRPEGDIMLSCHIDVLDRVDLEALILDWKHTRLDLNYAPQMLFYGWVYMLENPDVERVRCALVFLRDKTANVQLYTRKEIEEFGRRYTEQVIDWDRRTFTPGGHCEYCHRFHSCPAQKEMVEATLKQLSIVDCPGDIQLGKMLDLYEKAGVIQGLCKKFRDHVHAAVAHQGEITAPDGRRLTLVDSHRDKINGKLAWKALRKELTVDQIGMLMSVDKGEMLRMIAEKAPRGEKKKAKDEFMKELVDAGAVSTTEFTVLRVLQPKSESREVEIVESAE